MNKEDIYRSYPDTIRVEDYHKYRLHRDTPSPITPYGSTVVMDVKVLRKAQLALRRAGHLDCFVSSMYVARLVGYDQYYVKYVLKRLADRGYIERHWRPRRDNRERMRAFHYWLNGNASLAYAK